MNVTLLLDRHGRALGVYLLKKQALSRVAQYNADPDDDAPYRAETWDVTEGMSYVICNEFDGRFWENLTNGRPVTHLTLKHAKAVAEYDVAEEKDLALAIYAVPQVDDWDVTDLGDPITVVKDRG